jgi:hypothetical protein
MLNKEFKGVPLIESPFFENLKRLLPANIIDIAEKLNQDGYAVIDFPDELFDARIERIKTDLKGKYDFDSWKKNGWKSGGGLRLTDGWTFNEDIKAIATNKIVLALLRELYGREPFPFQTLNYPVGTQQSTHSDTAHFNSFPERWMCGVWVAFEDVDENNGPLVYYPGSHQWPILWGEHLGLDLSKKQSPGQYLFDPAWRKNIELSGIQPVYFYAKKGQAIIWASNLLHGGSMQLDSNRTRWSQVTHYYFEGCNYWRPYASNVSSGEIFSFSPPNILTGAHYSVSEKIKSKLPVDFDARKYKMLHPDLNCLSEPHAMEHWILNGQFEGRRYKK